MAVPSNLSGWFILSAIPARLADCLKIADEVGRCMEKGAGWTKEFSEQWATTYFSASKRARSPTIRRGDEHVAKLFFGQVAALAQQALPMRLEHFSVDGTLIDA